MIVLQDPDGSYVKHWVPEVAKLPKKYLHQPWLASAEAQKTAGVVLGETYPHRITGNSVMQVNLLLNLVPCICEILGQSILWPIVGNSIQIPYCADMQ